MKVFRPRLSPFPHSTILYRECMYCRTMIGTKDGEGETGVTSTACRPCRDEVIAEIKPLQLAVGA